MVNQSKVDHYITKSGGKWGIRFPLMCYYECNFSNDCRMRQQGTGCRCLLTFFDAALLLQIHGIFIFKPGLCRSARRQGYPHEDPTPLIIGVAIAVLSQLKQCMHRLGYLIELL